MKKIIILSLVFSPAMLLAEGLANIGALVNYILGFINLLLPLFAGLALLSFLWGLAKFISKSGDTAGRAEGKSLMIWGLAALFIMLSFLGLIQIAKNDLGLGVGTSLPLIKK